MRNAKFWNRCPFLPFSFLYSSKDILFVCFYNYVRRLFIKSPTRIRTFLFYQFEIHYPLYFYFFKTIYTLSLFLLLSVRKCCWKLGLNGWIRNIFTRTLQTVVYGTSNCRSWARALMKSEKEFTDWANKHWVNRHDASQLFRPWSS